MGHVQKYLRGGGGGELRDLKKKTFVDDRSSVESEVGQEGTLD